MRFYLYLKNIRNFQIVTHPNDPFFVYHIQRSNDFLANPNIFGYLIQVIRDERKYLC